MKTTIKDIKAFDAIDITYIKFDDMKKLRQKENGFNEIAYSQGLYGINAIVIQGQKSKKLYKITNRTKAIFMI